MRKAIGTMVILIGLLMFISTGVWAQVSRFVSVEGPNLKSRLEAAVQRGRSGAQGTYFWAAYAFDVRPGVSVDFEINHGWEGTTVFYGTRVAPGSPMETRNLGIFFLYEPDTRALARVQIYNMDRPREYAGYPVYWLGRATSEESLSLLQGLVEAGQANDIGKRAVMAIALHDGPQVEGLLKNIARAASNEEARQQAIASIGHMPGQQAFLADLVRNEKDNLATRQQAVKAIGRSPDTTSLATLQNLFESVANQAIKERILDTALRNEKQEEAVQFLIRVAEGDPDPVVRKRAVHGLGQKKDLHSLAALERIVFRSNSSLDLQKQALSAIHRRPKDQAIPLLAKIAKEHPSADVRKAVVQRLRRVDDARVQELFKDIISK